MIIRRCRMGVHWDPLSMRVVFIYDHSIDAPVIFEKIIDEAARKRLQDVEYQMIRGRE